MKPAILLLAPLVLPLAAHAEQHLQVIDRVGPTEVEEATTIYIDDVLAGTFRLDAGTSTGRFAVAVPDAPSHQYRMCGKVTTRDPDGQVRAHVVDTSGTLGEVDGRTFEALTTNFTSYYLEDVTPDRAPSAIQRNQGRGCAPAVS
jgi:hypothetical protein